MLNHHVQLEVLEEHGEGLLARAANSALDRRVRNCPGWHVDDLLWHVGGVWDFWSRVVEQGLTTSDEVRALREPLRPGDHELLDWSRSRLRHLQDVLAATPIDAEVWTWADTRGDAGWVSRRMAHEAIVHHMDMAQVGGGHIELDPHTAADGVDEFLSWFAGRREVEGAEEPGGSVHLHATDTDGEWFVADLASRPGEVAREHSFGDAGVRGPAEQLLRWVWRRDPAEVDVFGDTGVAERFRAFSRLT